jgi:ribonuclease BN (tRNA processing enzyme)
VNVTILPSACAAGGDPACQFLTTYLVNGRLAIDAGALGLLQPVAAQARVRHVLLTHTHIDHVASLPVFLENVYAGTPDAVTVHGTREVLDALRQDVFNDRLWPDFIGLSRPEAPFLRLSVLEPGRPVVLDGLRVTPVPVNHVVPTVGVLVEEGTTAALFSSDTGPTDALWELANAAAGLKAVFLEATFPEDMAWLADVSKHLTPRQFAAEAAKLRRPVELLAVHLKPRYRARVAAELLALGLPHMRVAEVGQTYTVSGGVS